jgi:hypothetical protein
MATSKQKYGQQFLEEKIDVLLIFVFINSRGVKIVARELKLSRDKSQSVPMFKCY